MNRTALIILLLIVIGAIVLFLSSMNGSSSGTVTAVSPTGSINGTGTPDEEKGNYQLEGTTMVSVSPTP